MFSFTVIVFLPLLIEEKQNKKKFLHVEFKYELQLLINFCQSVVDHHRDKLRKKKNSLEVKVITRTSLIDSL